MKTNLIISTNAILWMALGIAFALYSPNILNLFGVPGLLPECDELWYWNVVAFARLFGALIFGFGLLMFAIKGLVVDPAVKPELKRLVLSALIVSNAITLLVLLTQQVSIWGTPAGWVMAGFPAVFMVLYGYALWKLKIS